MHSSKRTMVIVNVFGGIAVLGSYAHGILTTPEAGAVLWGGVPETLRPLYTISMFSAAAGYFAFTGFLLFAVDADRDRVAGRYGFGLINTLYAVILVASAMWMPLTLAAVASGSEALWVATRGVLAATAMGTLGLLGSVLLLDRRTPRFWYALAVIGLIAFAVQTVALDALVWPAYFRG